MSDIAKMNAARAALEYIKDGMVVGLGTGSTASHFVKFLGERVRAGVKIKGVPTSEVTRKQAEAAGIPLVDLDHVLAVDVDVDGADEIDPKFQLIKGGGGALLREKLVAAASGQMIVIAGEDKAVDQLGAFPLPIEVIPFGFTITARRIYQVLRTCGCAGTEVVLRERDGKPWVTDCGNYILDARTQSIPDAPALAYALKNISGVVEHGLFIGMARTLVLGRMDGFEVREI